MIKPVKSYDHQYFLYIFIDQASEYIHGHFSFLIKHQSNYFLTGETTRQYVFFLMLSPFKTWVVMALQNFLPFVTISNFFTLSHSFLFLFQHLFKQVTCYFLLHFLSSVCPVSIKLILIISISFFISVVASIVFPVNHMYCPPYLQNNIYGN